MENFDFDFDDTYVLNYVNYSELEQVNGQYSAGDDFALPSYEIANMTRPMTQQFTATNEPMYAAGADNFAGNAVIHSANWVYPEMSSAQTMSQSLQQPKAKRFRTLFSSEQLCGLEEQFQAHQYLARRRRIELSKELKIGERQIKIWFQNRRMKEKRESRKKGTNQNIRIQNINGRLPDSIASISPNRTIPSPTTDVDIRNNLLRLRAYGSNEQQDTAEFDVSYSDDSPEMTSSQSAHLPDKDVYREFFFDF